MKAIIGFGDNAKKLGSDEIVGAIFLEDHMKILRRYSSIGRKAFLSNETNEIMEQGKVVSNITGSWLKSIYFDDKEYWNSKQNCYKMHMCLDVLPSDWRFREDIIWMLYGLYDNANKWK